MFYFAQIVLIVYVVLWAYSYMTGSADPPTPTHNSTTHDEVDIPVKPSLPE